MDSLNDYMTEVLKKSFSRPWANQPKIEYRICFENENNNYISGVLKLYGTGRKTGIKSVLLDISFSNLSSKVDIDNFYANAFSKLLGQHIKWPK